MAKTTAVARTAKKQDEIMTLEKREEVELLKNTYAKGSTDTEFKMLFAVANRIGADPFRKEIYLIPFWDSEAKRMGRTPVVGIDWYRKKAGTSPNYAGQGEAEFGPEEKTNGCTHPAWAVVPIYNHKFTQPVRVKAFWNEVVKIDKQGIATGNWARMPHTMLAKCSEAQGIRKAFPEEVAGVYIEEEMVVEVSNIAVEKPKTNIEAEAPVTKEESGARKEKETWLLSLLKTVGKDVDAFVKYLGKGSLSEIDEIDLDSWITKLETEIEKAKATAKTSVSPEAPEEIKQSARDAGIPVGDPIIEVMPEEMGGPVGIPSEVCQFVNLIANVDDRLLSEDMVRLKNDTNSGEYKGLNAYPSLQEEAAKVGITIN